LKLRVTELEKKLEGVRQELSIVESKLAVKDADLCTLRNSLKELEELREMKAVSIHFSAHQTTVF